MSDFHALALECLPLKRRKLHSKPCFATGVGFQVRGCAVPGGVFEGKMNDFRVLELEGLALKRRKMHSKPCFAAGARFQVRGCAVPGGVFEGKNE